MNDSVSFCDECSESIPAGQSRFRLGDDHLQAEVLGPAE